MIFNRNDKPTQLGNKRREGGENGKGRKRVDGLSSQAKNREKRGTGCFNL